MILILMCFFRILKGKQEICTQHWLQDGSGKCLLIYKGKFSFEWCELYFIRVAF
jgi:hypothetical protein